MTNNNEAMSGIQAAYVVGGGDGKEVNTPDLIDLVIRITRKVAELESQVDSNSKDIVKFAETSAEADYKAGESLLQSALRKEEADGLEERIEMLTDDIVMLDERTAESPITNHVTFNPPGNQSISEIGRRMREVKHDSR